MDKTEIVQKMQEYISEHLNEEDFNLDCVYEAVGYSRRHADRVFKELVGRTPQSYVKAICLTEGAGRLLGTGDTVLEIALDSRFQSHEGFTRAFESRFEISPAEYRKRPIAIPLFVPYPVSHYQALVKHMEEEFMTNEMFMCTVTPVERPRRKLIFQRSRKAEDYFSYCQEMGCEWEGLLNSIPEKFDVAALIELPKCLIKEGYSSVASGVEVPLDYKAKVPEGYEIAELENCQMLYFYSEPYENEEDFCIAIESVYKAIERYKPANFGYQYDYDKAPSLNFGADAATGAKIAVPAVKI